MSLPLPAPQPLARVVADWETMAQEDPLWACCNDPAKLGRKWVPAEFFATGETEVARLQRGIDRQSDPVAREHVLDFGCGVGRVSFPLAQHFQKVTALDSSATMIAQAKQHNPSSDRVEFVQSADPKLPFADASFDVVYSAQVLRHLPIDASLYYVTEFLRVLRPRGLACFVVPACFARSITAERRETAVTLGAHKVSVATQTIPVSEVTGCLERAGATISTVEIDREADLMLATYIVRRA